MSRRLGPVALFVLGVALHVVLALVLREPAPGGLRADENVYLELASTLWREGTYGPKVSITYPPGYPMVAAPTFALASNAARFAVLRVGQALALAAASLLLLPMLRAALGRGRAWAALGALQLVAGAVFHGVFAQSEALYVVLLVAATGLVWTAWARDRAVAWLGLGLVAGLSVATRRMGVVVPIAVAMLVVLDLLQTRDARAWTRRLVLLGLGLGAGLLPEALASSLHGDSISPYSEGAAGSHLKAGLTALETERGQRLAMRVAGAQIAWPLLTTAAAPLLVAIAWLDRRTAPVRPPTPTARVYAFTLLTLAGSTALTVLHILRYRLGTGNRGWDLYPRYLDPHELPLLAVGVVAVAALVARGARNWRPLAWGAGVLGLVSMAGQVARTRGGRMIPPVSLQADGGLVGEIALWLIPGGAAAWCLLALLGIGLPPLRRRLSPVLWLACALSAGWLVSAHMPTRLVRGHRPTTTPAVLKAPALTSNPRAPLGVVVYRPGPYGRGYYEPAFRSDHPVWFLAPDEATAWAAAHPDGFVLLHPDDKRSPPGLERIGRVAGWTFLRHGDSE